MVIVIDFMASLLKQRDEIVKPQYVCSILKGFGSLVVEQGGTHMRPKAVLSPPHGTIKVTRHIRRSVYKVNLSDHINGSTERLVLIYRRIIN